MLNLIPEEGLSWVGTPNELVGAYAVDGYARTKRTPGALVTTFGPGELSALCGIAGAYCEFVPLGSHCWLSQERSTGQRQDCTSHAGGSELQVIRHFPTQNDYYVFVVLTYVRHYLKMSEQISCATTVLTDAATATAEIDRVLNGTLRQTLIDVIHKVGLTYQKPCSITHSLYSR